MTEYINVDPIEYEIVLVISGMHHDAHMLWREERIKQYKGLPFDKVVMDNHGMPEPPSATHIKGCQPCLAYLRQHAESACRAAKKLLIQVEELT